MDSKLKLETKNPSKGIHVKNNLYWKNCLFQELFREEYFRTLEILQEHIIFFRWFNQKKVFDNLLELKKKKSCKTHRGKIKADFPSTVDIEFKRFYNENIIAKPFQIIKKSEEHKAPANKEIESIQVQIN